eukprot:843626-Amorphochlora_amoeboformis.AAC.1
MVECELDKNFPLSVVINQVDYNTSLNYSRNLSERPNSSNTLQENPGSVNCRDVTSCHFILRSPVNTKYYRLLPEQTMSKNLRNLRRFLAINRIGTTIFQH